MPVPNQGAAEAIDWTRCPDVESVPDRCGGAWVVRGSRVIVESCILGNYPDCTPEEIADLFEVPGDVVRRILAYAATAATDDPETIYMSPICDACQHCPDAQERFWWDKEADATCDDADCPHKPTAYIRADLFYAQLAEATDRMIENTEAYNDERDLFIARLVSLLERARNATDDHQLFSDIGEALPNMSPPRQSGT